RGGAKQAGGEGSARCDAGRVGSERRRGVDDNAGCRSVRHRNGGPEGASVPIAARIGGPTEGRHLVLPGRPTWVQPDQYKTVWLIKGLQPSEFRSRRSRGRDGARLSAETKTD